jgi:hypothetical protein
MKFERIYPNYRDVYSYSGNCISIDRRCIDGVLRHVNTLYFHTIKVCYAYYLWLEDNR